jgi:hypothetical protein
MQLDWEIVKAFPIAVVEKGKFFKYPEITFTLS